MANAALTIHQNSQHMRVMNIKYKSKYKKLKERIKRYVFENAAICDEIAHVQSEIAIAREDRRFLINRLLLYEGSFTEEPDAEEKPLTQVLSTSAKVVNPPRKRGPKKGFKQGNNSLNKTSTPSIKIREKVSLNSDGKPKYPINLSNILIHSPGEIIPGNPNFHSAHWIYPVGYVATRIYAHPRDPQRKCVFTCKILNNAGRPQFQIIPDNDFDSVFFGESANSCHQSLLEILQRALTDAVKLPINVQGEKFFGLSNPTVKTLIQMDPGFKLCANFKCFTTVQDSSFTIPEDNDPTMNYDALQSLITLSVYHSMPVVKDELPDELLDCE